MVMVMIFCAKYAAAAESNNNIDGELNACYDACMADCTENPSDCETSCHKLCGPVAAVPRSTEAGRAH